MGIPVIAPCTFWPAESLHQRFPDQKLKPNRADRASGNVTSAWIRARGCSYEPEAKVAKARPKKRQAPGASVFWKDARSGRTSGSYLHWGSDPTDLTGRSSSPPSKAPAVPKHHSTSSQSWNQPADPAPPFPWGATCSNSQVQKQSPARDA